MRLCAVALLIGVLLCGCSASSMKATPIWDDDFARAEGPSENRINVWPLLYYRKPALSLLWPLFSRSDEGQELVPLYAYESETQALRLLSVFPWIPAGAQLEPEYTRVLGVISDRKNDAFAVLPLYYGGKTGFWTPPLLHLRDGEEHIDGLLAPLTLHTRGYNAESWSLAWPLLSSWRDGETRGLRAVPLFWSERWPGGSIFNVGGLLFDRRGTGDKRNMFWLWPLGADQRAGETRSSRFLPLWYWKKDPAESLFLSVPYQALRERERVWQSAFGLVHRIRDRDGSGHAVLPLYWRYRSESTQTLLTLAGGYSKSPDSELVDVLGPLYWSRRKEDTRRTGVLWPLASRTTTPDTRETWLLLGLAGAERGPRQKLWAYPLFGWSKEAERTWFWSPALSLTRIRHDRAKAERFVRESLAAARGTKYESGQRSAPLASDEVGHLLGMAGENTWESLAGSIDASGQVALRTLTRHESFLRPLWLLPLWEHQRDEDRSSSELLWRLYDSRSERRDDGQVYARQRVLWRLVHRETLGTRRSLDVFPFITYDRDEKLLQWSFMGGLIGWRHAGDQRVARLFWIPLARGAGGTR